MIKAIQAIQNIKKNPQSNFLLVGDNDFLYIYIKNLIKKSNTDSLESITFECSDKASVQDDILNSLSAIDLFQSKKIIIIKNINKISKKNKDIFINALSNNDNSNIIICTDSSFLGFDYKSKKNFIKSQFVNDITPFFHVIDISVPFESEMNKWIKENHELKDYQFRLKDMYRMQKHVLSENKERLLSYYSQSLMRQALLMLLKNF